MLTRIKLAGYSLLISWTLNTLGEVVCRLIWGSGDRFPGLSVLAAPVYLLTYIMFVVPLVGCCRTAWQIRFWYVLLLASFTWATLACSLVFHDSPKNLLLGPWPSQCAPIWFSECALRSMTIYLILIRSAVRRGNGASSSNLAA